MVQWRDPSLTLDRPSPGHFPFPLFSHNSVRFLAAARDAFFARAGRCSAVMFWAGVLQPTRRLAWRSGDCSGNGSDDVLGARYTPCSGQESLIYCSVALRLAVSEQASQILSPLRLPISPPGHVENTVVYYTTSFVKSCRFLVLNTRETGLTLSYHPHTICRSG